MTRKMYSLLLCTERMSTLMCGASLRSTSVTARPFMPGMLMSIRTTSGDSSRALRRASSPSAASPTTLQLSLPGEAGLQSLPDHRMIVRHQHFDYLFLRAHLSALSAARQHSCPAPVSVRQDLSQSIRRTEDVKHRDSWCSGLRRRSRCRRRSRAGLPLSGALVCKPPMNTGSGRLLDQRHGNQHHWAPAQRGLGAGGGAALRRLGHQQSLRHRPGASRRSGYAALPHLLAVCFAHRRWSASTTSGSASTSPTAAASIPRPACTRAGWRRLAGCCCWRISSSPPSLSCLDAFHYLGFADPAQAKKWAITAIFLIGAINFLGPKHTGGIAVWLAVPTVVVVMIARSSAACRTLPEFHPQPPTGGVVGITGSRSSA